MSGIVRTFLRPLMTERGMVMVRTQECVCGSRRGPSGGVCGNCGLAIPTLEEEIRESQEGGRVSR